jgi:hypothetical protein
MVYLKMELCVARGLLLGQALTIENLNLTASTMVKVSSLVNLKSS